MFVSNFRLKTILLLGSVAVMVVVSPVQATEHYALGMCQTATQSEGTEIRPISAAGIYLVEYHGDDQRYKAKLASGQFFSGANVTLIETPKHGKVALADVPNVSNGQYHYMPENGYVGSDNFVMQVEKDGVKVRIEYLIEGLTDDEPTTAIGDDGERQGIYCQPDEWKISANTSIIDNASLQALTNAVGINNTFIVNASALTGGVVGQTTDYTPYLSYKYESTYSDVASHPHIKSIT